MLDLLSDIEIVRRLSPLIRNELAAHLVVLSTVDSTNNYLWQHPACKVCLAECQTAGRGRQGRNWISPYASGLYLSIRCSYDGFDLEQVNVGGLSVALTVNVAKVLRDWGVDCQIKWCNDIICQDRKLAGMLLETRWAAKPLLSTFAAHTTLSSATGLTKSQSSTASSPNCLELVMGLGINVQLPAEHRQPGWTDLRQVLPIAISRNELAATVIEVSWRTLMDYRQWGLTSECLREWQILDRLYQQPVWLKLPDNQWVYGTALGIDQQGALQIREGNSIHRYVHGEVTVRRKNGDLYW